MQNYKSKGMRIRSDLRQSPEQQVRAEADANIHFTVTQQGRCNYNANSFGDSLKLNLHYYSIIIYNIYLRLVSQTVQSRQFGQFGEASVIDAEVQVFVQDAEVLIAAFHNPTTTLQEDDSEQSNNKRCQGLNTAATFHHFHSGPRQPQTQQLSHGCKLQQHIRAIDGERKKRN